MKLKKELPKGSSEPYCLTAVVNDDQGRTETTAFQIAPNGQFKTCTKIKDFSNKQPLASDHATSGDTGDKKSVLPKLLILPRPEPSTTTGLDGETLAESTTFSEGMTLTPNGNTTGWPTLESTPNVKDAATSPYANFTISEVSGTETSLEKITSTETVTVSETEIDGVTKGKSEGTTLHNTIGTTSTETSSKRGWSTVTTTDTVWVPSTTVASTESTSMSQLTLMENHFGAVSLETNEFGPTRYIESATSSVTFSSSYEASTLPEKFEHILPPFPWQPSSIEKYGSGVALTLVPSATEKSKGIKSSLRIIGHYLPTDGEQDGLHVTSKYLTPETTFPSIVSKSTTADAIISGASITGYPESTSDYGETASYHIFDGSESSTDTSLSEYGFSVLIPESDGLERVTASEIKVPASSGSEYDIVASEFGTASLETSAFETTTSGSYSSETAATLVSEYSETESSAGTSLPEFPFPIPRADGVRESKEEAAAMACKLRDTKPIWGLICDLSKTTQLKKRS